MIYSFQTSEKMRLDEFLRQNLPTKIKSQNIQAVSNSKIRRLIVSGAVCVNERTVVRPAFELRGNSRISVNFDEEKFFFEKQPDDIKFELEAENVLFEDDYLICVNKPAFFPTEETIVGSQKRDNLHDAVVRYLWRKNPSLRNPPYVGIMHRLDRETSGVILFTKQRSVNKAVFEMFEKHDFIKIYKALCTDSFNKIKNESSYNFSVEIFMNRISSKSQKGKWGEVLEKNGGLYSKTDFSLVEVKKKGAKKYYLFEARLFTGRTHQIRVHLSKSGFPIAGDELYDGEKAERIFLHAEKLEFVHPVTNQKISVFARCPF